MGGEPVAGDVDAPGDPDALVAPGVIEKAFERSGAAGRLGRGLGERDGGASGRGAACDAKQPEPLTLATALSTSHLWDVDFWFGSHFVARQSAEPLSAKIPIVDPALNREHRSIRFER